MRLETSLVQKAELQLRLAPQIIASIEILQIPATKLEELIHQEMEKNPTIELEEEDRRTEGEKERSENASDAATAAEVEAAVSTDGADAQLEEGFNRLQEYESSFREFSSGRGGGVYGEDGKDKKLEAMNNTAARSGTLQEYLASQLRLLDHIPEHIAEFAEYIIFNIGEDGYLPYSVEELLRSYYSDEVPRPTAELTGEGGTDAGAGDGDGEAEDASDDGGDATATATEARKERLPLPPGFVTEPARGPDNGGGGIPSAGTRSVADLGYLPPAVLKASSEIFGGSRPEEEMSVLDRPAPVEEERVEERAPAEEPAASAETEAPAAERVQTVSDELESPAPTSESGRNQIVLDLEEAEEALQIVQSLDPPGVAARDLKECLLLQLGDDDGSLERKLIESHLEDIVNNRLPKISKETGATIDEIKEGLELIRALNPRPGSVFSSETEQTQYITPDVVVDKVDDRWEVRLEDSFIPRINISQHYQKMLAEKKDDPKVREWIKRKIDDANWLIQAIAQRQSTLSKIAKEIISYQEGYLEDGIEHLRPLKMQHIADRVGVHVSTVSRAIASKYIQTPRGIVPLKFFFTAGTQRADGESESIVAIKQRVREIVDKEDKRCPLSDEEIAAKLKEAGLDIARRTVTKYRKQLKIPSSRQRREY